MVQTQTTPDNRPAQCGGIHHRLFNGGVPDWTRVNELLRWVYVDSLGHFTTTRSDTYALSGTTYLAFKDDEVICTARLIVRTGSA